jgi:two-component system sensor histidine kinase/response regulator
MAAWRWKLIHERKPHLVLSDIIMPEMDGYSLCRAIKSDPALRDIPVILVTSLNDPKDIIRGIECGADNFIRKPYAEDYLLSRISHMLMNQKLRKSQNIRDRHRAVSGRAKALHQRRAVSRSSTC